MRIRPGAVALGLIAAALAGAGAWVGRTFDNDMADARARAARGGVVVRTRCGPIEYEAAGQGAPLLMIHGAGGGHDQGMAFAGSLPTQGIRVIAVSRFGYLGTPMRPDASPAAQADAHACLLDALGLRQAAVVGGSAGAPSALQLAIRHPERVSALVLLVPIAYKPPAVADSAPAPSALADRVLERLTGSDFLYWTMLHVARDQVIRRVLATPPDLVPVASPAEQQRVNAMLEQILPLSARAAGLRNDAIVTRTLQRSALEAVRAPTLVISSRDDGYGTYASAQYTAAGIRGAKFIGYEQGGHIWVGHDEAVRQEIAKLVIATARAADSPAGAVLGTPPADRPAPAAPPGRAPRPAG